MRRRLLHSSLVAVAALTFIALLTGCGLLPDSFFNSGERPLPGKRVPVFDRTANAPSPRRAGYAAPQETGEKDWQQSAGNAQNFPGNRSGRAKPERVWQSKIGGPNSLRASLSAIPVVVGQRVFTLDSSNQVSALQLSNGRVIWDKRLQLGSEQRGGFSGALAYADNRLYVGGGAAIAFALNAANGHTLWRQRLSAPARGGLTAVQGRVFVPTIDNQLSVLQAQDGALLWKKEAASQHTLILRRASPAVSDRFVYAPYSNGDLLALRLEDGSEVWRDSITGQGGGLLGDLPDLSANPVLHRNQLIVTSQAGLTLLYDAQQGAVLWETPFGGSETPAVTDSHIFLLSSDQILVAIERETGGVVWQRNLVPDSLRDASVKWFGPIFFGGNLALANTKDSLLIIDPRSGRTLFQTKVEGGAAVPPVAANGYLLLLNNRGYLMAYR